MRLPSVRFCPTALLQYNGRWRENERTGRQKDGHRPTRNRGIATQERFRAQEIRTRSTVQPDIDRLRGRRARPHRDPRADWRSDGPPRGDRDSRDSRRPNDRPHDDRDPHPRAHTAARAVRPGPLLGLG